jgi:ParB family chromosome partitioning protein
MGGGTIAMLDISQIEANPFQPRTHFDKEALSELATSIQTYGIIQPLTVRKVSAKKYQLISGERRFRASQLADLEEVPAYIREADDQAMLEMALVENIQRENLDAIEVAISYKRLMDECQLTQEQLSERLGKNRSTIANYLRLLKLPAEIQVGIIEKKISMGHARALVNAGSERVQSNMYRRILNNDLSVRQLEDLIRSSKEKPAGKRKATAALSFQHQKLRDDLISRLDTKVKISKKEDGSGKLEIPFNSEDDLDRLFELLDK